MDLMNWKTWTAAALLLIAGFAISTYFTVSATFFLLGPRGTGGRRVKSRI